MTQRKMVRYLEKKPFLFQTLTKATESLPKVKLFLKSFSEINFQISTINTDRPNNIYGELVAIDHNI